MRRDLSEAQTFSYIQDATLNALSKSGKSSHGSRNAGLGVGEGWEGGDREQGAETQDPNEAHESREM